MIRNNKTSVLYRTENLIAPCSSGDRQVLRIFCAVFMIVMTNYSSVLQVCCLYLMLRKEAIWNIFLSSLFLYFTFSGMRIKYIFQRTCNIQENEYRHPQLMWKRAVKIFSLDFFFQYCTFIGHCFQSSPNTPLKNEACENFQKQFISSWNNQICLFLLLVLISKVLYSLLCDKASHIPVELNRRDRMFDSNR